MHSKQRHPDSSCFKNNGRWAGEDTEVRKYLVAAVLIGAFSAPAFAEEIYVAFDPASHKCTMMHSQPASGMKVMGTYVTEALAHKAMAGMKECQPG